MGKQLRILSIRQLGGIGDNLMLIPALVGLRKKFPKAHINHVSAQTYLGSALVDIMSHLPRGVIDELHVIEPWDSCPVRTREVWAKFYAQCPPFEDDPWFQRHDMHFDFNTPCVDYEWDAMMSPEGITKSRTQAWADYAEVELDTHLPQYVVTNKERAWAKRLYEERGIDSNRVIGIGATACDNKRAVGQGKLREVCDRLAAEGWLPVIIDPTFKFDNHLSFNSFRVSELMALIEQMKVVVSVDSGLLHMAGALKVPVVGIFGPTDSAMRMGPYIGSAIDSRKIMPCAPCWYSYPCTSNSSPIKPFACLNKITADMIVEETLRWTRGTGLRVVQSS